MTKVSLITVILGQFLALSVWAQGDGGVWSDLGETVAGSGVNYENSAGVTLSAGLGQSAVRLKPPSGEEAIYTSYNLLGELALPLYDTRGFGVALSLNGRYMDITNNAESDTQREAGSHIGVGPGLKFNLYRLLLSVDYYATKARHYWVGQVNDYHEFNFGVTSVSAGLDFVISKRFRINLTYSAGSANIPAEKLEMSSDSKYSDEAYWLKFTFSSGRSLGEFFSDVLNPD